jgi:hypothetical protein
MSLLRSIVAAFFLFVVAPLGLCCSCSNNVPVQQPLEQYRDRAVFKAHILGWLGSAEIQGMRVTDRAIAIVREEYWGFPRYWPSIVVIRSSPLCGMLFHIGEDYLVSGWRVGYGELDLNECSRTQIFAKAQLDLRTMDGTHCAMPGGTVIGHTYRGHGNMVRTVAPNTPVAFLDENGKKYEARSDGNGIYELNHLAPGFYTAESPPGENDYASAPGVNVESGLCIDMPIVFKDFSVRGRLLPDLVADVGLIGLDPDSKPFRASIEPNGNFYFANPPDGEYVLSVTTWVNGSPDQLYFPGVSNRQQAEKIEIKNNVLAGRQNLDFDPARLPMVKIPVTFDPTPDSRRYTWRVQILRDNLIQNEARVSNGRAPVGAPSVLYGTRGTAYQVLLFGWSNDTAKYENCRSESVAAIAQANMPAVQIKVPPNCR